MSKHRPDSDDDTEWFRQAMADVRPLRSDRAATRAPPAAPAARQARADEARVLADSLNDPRDRVELESGEGVVFRRAGVTEASLRKLRRARYRIEAELDLHGLNAAEAQRALKDFIAECLDERVGCVRIVHGKGLRSGPRGPVLKHSVGLWLRRLDAVLAFSSARPVDGGTGALYVLLRRA